MLIDWFTTAAQVVNFLILVWLLKRFLYGPIIRAMEAREKKIASRLEEADQQKQEAEEQKGDYAQKRREIEESRDQLLQEAKEDANDKRQELVRQAREETDQLRAKWQKSLQRERDSLLRDLRRTVAREACAVARHTLAEMADADLQERMFAVWRERLNDLEEDERKELGKAAGEAKGGLVVRTAFELSADQRRHVTKLLHQHVDQEVDVGYDTDEDLVCGVELRADGYRLGWSVADHLQQLEESVGELIEAAREQDAGEDQGEEEQPQDTPQPDRQGKGKNQAREDS